MNNDQKKLPKAGDTVQIEKMIHVTERGSIGFWDSDMSAYDCGACLGKSTISFVMPDGDPVAQMVKALKEQIKAANAEHHVKVTNLENKVQQLLAIGHDGN